MSTLTLSRFAKTLTGNNEKPAQPTLAPIAAAVAMQSPAVVQKPQEPPKQEPAALVMVETAKPPVTIAPITTTENEMGKKEDLKAKQAKLQAELDATMREMQELRDSERADVLKATQAAMAEYGFTADELLGRTPAQRRAGKGIPRGPASVKFQDKATGLKWSGRGQQPRWLSEAIAKTGKKLEDFAV